MSKTTKIVIAVVVIAAVAYGVYRWMSKSKETAPASNPAAPAPAAA